MLTASPLCCKGPMGQKIMVVAGVLKFLTCANSYSIAGLPHFVLLSRSRHISHHAHTRGMQRLKTTCRPYLPVLAQEWCFER